MTSPSTGTTDLVTGAFGFTGRYLTQRLHDRGHRVRTLTNHPPAVGPDNSPDAVRSDAENPPDAVRTVEVMPYRFDEPAALLRAFEGVDTFYNTYWVRYSPAAFWAGTAGSGTTYDQAVAHTEAMFRAARSAGVRRIVHVSITNPDPDSFDEYYRGKARLARSLAELGVPYVIVRPSVVFGPDDILINNIAHLLRRFHVFAIPGDGRYRLRPVHVDDLAALCVELGTQADGDGITVDAVGPETFSFEELVGTLAQVCGVRWYPVHLPVPIVGVLLRGLSLLMRDVVLTTDEVRGLMAGLVTTDGPATCPTRLTDYLRENPQVGRRYHSELGRRGRPTARRAGAGLRGIVGAPA